ncbi:MAG: endonuclease/exonuclease/phosphatase family protein [Kiritimatiellae bacterium]|nr:endonuclease/exonuclease/phosphatase family protein [Kiritimatiellia bacterium]
MKKSFLFLFAAMWLFSAGTLFGAVEPSRELVLCNWNLENLFDTEDDPANKGDDGFTPRGWMRWTNNRYRLKLQHLSDIIAQMRPDILCVEEVENRRVLEDLVKTLQERCGYELPEIIHRDSGDKRGIDVAILSKTAPVHVEWVTPYQEMRDTVVATFSFGGRQLHVLANHWKSKLGKQNESEALRRVCAKAVRDKVDAILKKTPDAAILVTGDFNDEASAPPLCEIGLFKTNLAEVVADRTQRYLYNLTGELSPNEKGTYYYATGRTWNLIDAMIVTRGMWGDLQPQTPWQVQKGSYRIFKTPAQCTKLGTPFPFRRVRKKGIGDSYMTGYSDHFPIRVVLIPRDD